MPTEPSAPVPPPAAAAPPSAEPAPPSPTAEPTAPVPTPPGAGPQPARPWGIVAAVGIVVVLVVGGLLYGWTQGWFGNSSTTPAPSSTTSQTKPAPATDQLTSDFSAADQSLAGVTTDANNASDSLNDKQGDLTE